MSRADEPHFPSCSDQDFPSKFSLSHECSVTHRSLQGCPSRRLPYSAQSLLAVLHVDHQCDPVQLLSCSSCFYMFVSFNLRDDTGLILSHPTLVLILCTVGWNQRVQTQVSYLLVENNIKMTSQGPSSPEFWFTAVISGKI